MSDGDGGDLFGEKPLDRTPSPSRAMARKQRDDKKTPEDYAAGHRQRLRARFMAGGESAVAAYELLELVLFRAIPRRDVKPLAKRLLERFGDVAAVLAAEPERLREIDGLGDAAIIELKIVEAAAMATTRARAQRPASFTSGDAVIGYLRSVMARRNTEEFRVLFLDKKNQLIRDEAIGRGTVDQIAVYPREVVTRALELRASAVILVHNHPSGDPTPSRADIAMTKRIVEAAKAVDIAVLDHFIVGADDWLSFRARNLL